MAHNYETRPKSDGPILVLRDGSEVIGWLAPEYPDAGRRRGHVYRRTDQWTGRWTVTATCLGIAEDTVSSPAEGMLMVARITEIHEQEGSDA